MADDFTDGPERPSVRNELSGSGDVLGPVIQAGQIHGGIAFHVRTPATDGPPARPDQVPALTVTCVNRDDVLTFLDGALVEDAGQAPRVGIGVLSGLPGIGKTTVACRWAELVRERFPDGQIFIDFAALRARSGGDVSAAVRMCLKALGVADPYIPESLQERTAEFRSRSADRRILVVLDDVNQPAQVRPLMPKGPGSMVLVTSHGRLAELVLDGARLRTLEPLDSDSGLRLLTGRLGAEAVAADPEAARRLVSLCAGLPKALQLAAARLLTNRRLTLHTLTVELADEASRLSGLSLRGDSVSAVLELSYRDLPADAARLYRVLGWLPGETFDLGTAAAAANIDTATAESLLAVLEEASLLDVTPDGRFRCHQLVRLHARKRADAEETELSRRTVVERVATHYLALTAFADRAVRADRLRVADLTDLLRTASDPFTGERGPAPLEWLEAERGNILAVLRAAAEYGLHKHVWQVAESFTVLFLHRRQLAEWKESLELGAVAAAEAVVPAAEARLRSLLSRPLMDLGELDRARVELDSAVACAEVAAHTALTASVQEFLGRYWDRFDADRAMAAYRRALELNGEAGEWRGVAIVSYFLGCAQDTAGRHREALETLRRARADLAAREDHRMAGRALAAIGGVHDHLGDPDAAVRALTEAAELLRAEGASHYEAQALVRLADITQRTGAAPRTVRRYLLRAFEIYQAGGSPDARSLRERLDRLEGADGPGHE